ncbi:MAG: glycerol-3-phosphate 1-O-acyltransferase PlsY [Actinomycetota bacterium]|nr:glycerol-3-phosphate 1-O-acyltransferase PlsY [Actinomycetota bacterium]
MIGLVLRFWAAYVLAYLLGAIPFALIVGKVFYKTDLREHGSGNLGGTNVYRVLGWKAGLAVVVLDIAKGAAAVAIAMLLHPTHMGAMVHDWVLIGAMIAAVLGHSYSPYIKFRGGKGVAAAAGGLLVIEPLALLILLLVFAGVIAASRMVSLASIVVAAAYPALTIALYGDRTALVAMSFFAAAIVLWRHRGNMVRIWRREEAKISYRRRETPATEDRG